MPKWWCQCRLGSDDSSGSYTYSGLGGIQTISSKRCSLLAGGEFSNDDGLWGANSGNLMETNETTLMWLGSRKLTVVMVTAKY